MGGEIRHLVKRGDAFWARLVVPKDLRPTIGKTELRTPLGSNRKTAERELHAAVANFHDTLAAARAALEVSANPPARMRSRHLTTPQIAHTHFSEELALDDAERNSPDPTALTDLGWARDGHIAVLGRVASGKADNDLIAASVGWALKKFRERGSTAVEPGSPEWRALARTLAQVQLEAIEATQARDAGREPEPPKLPILAEPPTPVPAGQQRQRGPAISILDLLDGYLATLKANGKGVEAERRWKPAFKALVRHLGHDDVRHMAKADIAGWRDQLLQDGLAPKTIRDVHLASVRAVLRWAREESKVTENPAAEVRIKVTEKVHNREKGFTAQEARAILMVALAYQPPKAHSSATRESEFVTDAKRWLPWLCAHTGCRVAEAAQLRKQDIQTIDGITFARITPEAGSTKTGKYRDVPVHPQLVELGFLDFVVRAGEGTALFYDIHKPRRGVQHPAKHIANRVSAWVRSLDLFPSEIDPSHGWRHRFKTVGREEEISDRVLDAIQGHAGRTKGEDYGDVTLKTRDRAIRKMPGYALDD